MDVLDEYIIKLIDNGLLCKEYLQRYDNAMSLKQIADIALDANGISYLCEMEALGFVLEHGFILANFGRFINGNYQFASKGENSGYTTRLYVDVSGMDCVMDSTATALLNCSGRIELRENETRSLYVGPGCAMDVFCAEGSRLYVNRYGDTDLKYHGNGKVIVRHNKKI